MRARPIRVTSVQLPVCFRYVAPSGGLFCFFGEICKRLLNRGTKPRSYAQCLSTKRWRQLVLPTESAPVAAVSSLGQSSQIHLFFNYLLARYIVGCRRPERAARKSGVKLGFPTRKVEICDKPIAFPLRCHTSETGMVPPASSPFIDSLLDLLDVMIASNPPALAAES